MEIWSTLYEDCAQVVCEQTAALPDYYPPVMRVVRAQGQPCVKEIREQEGVVTVSGEVELTLLYQTEDERGLCAYHASAPYSHSFSLPEGVSGTADGYTGLAQVSCRLSAARRVSFRVTVPLYLSVSGTRKAGGLPPQENMLYLVKSVEGRCGLGCATRRFHVSERGECDRVAAAALETDVVAAVTEVTAAGGKTLVKGELSVRTLFVTREDEVGMVRYQFPVSQLLDVPSGTGIDVEAVFRVGRVETEVGEHTEGGKGRFGYEIDLAVVACASEMRTQELVCDAFSTTHALLATRESSAVTQLVERLRGNVEISLPIPEETEDGTLVDVWAAVGRLGGVADGAKLALEGECRLTLLYQEDSGRIRSREALVPLRAELPCRREGEGAVQGCVWSVLAMPDCLRLNLRYEASLRRLSNCEYLSSAAPDLEKPLPELKRHPVTVYFAEAGESVWDIAKRYRIAPTRIRERNGLQEDTLSEKKRLLIL